MFNFIGWENGRGKNSDRPVFSSQEVGKNVCVCVFNI